jgi:hypothetical protein
LAAESERLDIMEGWVPSETKEETAHGVRAGDVGAPATLGTFAPLYRKSRIMVVHLDRLALYEGTARDERP